VKAPDHQALETILNPRFAVHSVALFNPDASVKEGQIGDTLPQPLQIKANVDSYGPGRVAMTLSEPAPEGSALVVSENYYPDWTATVDGKSVKAERADFTFIGIALPAGARKVMLEFRSPAYETGKTITLGAAVLALAFLVVGMALERRKVV
jgi:hypothetical protein